MNGQKKLFWLFLLCCLFFAPQASQASTASKAGSTTKLAGVKVHLYSKLGGEWFIGKTKKINKDGVLEYKNAVPGWGKVLLAGSDTKKRSAAYAGETFTFKVRMLDDKGRRIRKATPVDIYAKIGGVKHFVATLKTDKDGWIIVPGAMLGTESLLDIKGTGSKFSKEDGSRPIVKVRSKMKEDGDWFTALQKKLDDDRTLTIRNAGPGKSEFKYVGPYEKISVSDLIDNLNESGKLSDKLAEKFKESDFAGKTFPKPFTLKVQILDEDGHSIKKPTTVRMTVYLKDRTIKGNMKTNSKGWLTIHGVPVNVQTKMEVED